MNNIFADIPSALPREVFEDLAVAGSVRIERILSLGHSSPESGWYDQAEHEWVMVLEGEGVIGFEDGREIAMTRGDYLMIPAGAKHRVVRTSDEQVTVWLAVFFQ